VNESINSSISLGYYHKLLESILNAGTDYICVKDRAGRFVYINELDASLYNAKPHDILGQTTEPFVGKAQFEEWYREDTEVLNSGQEKHYDAYSRTGHDGVIHWFDTVKIPFTDDRGEQELLLIIHRDITTIVEAEQERNLLREQMMASQKLETIGLLSASVAHDFNNMLTIILASSNLLTGKPNLDAETLFLAQSITKASERAADIVSRLLILSRRENVSHALLDLKQYLLETQTMLRAALGEKIQLKFDLCPEALPIDGNGTMVEQVLINLILNARDALPKGGVITVKASLTSDAGGAEFVTLEVRDNGIGMSPETLKKAFDPFYTTKPLGQGSGLGLAVVQSIMEQHLGTIAVESQLNTGTRFILKFPRAKGRKATGPVPVAAPTANLGGKTLLLVEDEELVRELICISLDAMGVKTVQAANGDEAWKRIVAAEPRIDCVLTDVVMDGELDGVSLRKKLFDYDSKIPVILMTGYSFNYFETAGSIPENTDILYKPFLLETLREKLLRLLNPDVSSET
jgi:two-component system cell cycle sensor histidine kinase/response regulator CckA